MAFWWGADTVLSFSRMILGEGMLSKAEYRQVAEAHAKGIFKGFLSTLGVSFLALLYEAIDKSDDSVLLVERANGRVVGFVAGTRSIGGVYRVMLHSWPRLVVALFPVLFSPRKLRRVIETVLFSRGGGQASDGLPPHELLSISVLKDFRGRGIAEKLFHGLVDHFFEQGVNSFKIVVGDPLEPAHRFYTRMGAVPVARAEVHAGSGSVIYIKHVI